MCSSNLDKNCKFFPDLDLGKACHMGKYFQALFCLFFPFAFGLKIIRPYSLLHLPPKDLQGYPGVPRSRYSSTQDQEYPGPETLVLRTRSTQEQEYLGAEVPVSDRRHVPL